MLIKTIKDYRDKETKEVFRVSDKNLEREVSEERGKELISLGFAEEVKVSSKKKKEETKETSDIVEDDVEKQSEETIEE